MSMAVYAPIANTVYNSAVASTGPLPGVLPAAGQLDLTAFTDVLITVTVPPGSLTGAGASLTVQLDGIDPAGSTIPAMVKTAAITGPGTYAVSGGLHTSNTVLPAKGQLTVALSGTSPAVAGITITVTGR